MMRRRKFTNPAERRVVLPEHSGSVPGLCSCGDEFIYFYTRYVFGQVEVSGVFSLLFIRYLDYCHRIASTMRWSRLIRFIDASGVSRFGEPEIKDATKLVEECLAGRLYAREFVGDEPFSLTEGSERLLVKEILGILRPSDVPIIRCVGLNYMKHSKGP